MERQRVWFSNPHAAKQFFNALKMKTGCKKLKELSKILGVSYGRLLMWSEGKRSLPRSLLNKWIFEFELDEKLFSFREFDLEDTMKKASIKGIRQLKGKFGLNWYKVLATKSMKLLRKRMSKHPEMEKKRKALQKAALVSRFGQNCFVAIGRLGGRASIQATTKERRAEILEKAFRSSFKKRIIFNGQKFRSVKEVEVAQVLLKNNIGFIYEPKLLGFYPDFII